MILSPVVIWFLTSAVLAVGVAVLILWKKRQERAVSNVSDQLRRLTFEPGATVRIGLEGSPKSFEPLLTSVNKLLDDMEQRGASLQGREQMFHSLVETVNHAVLIHGRQILFANNRFLTLLGLSADEVLGRPLRDFVAPEYVELVENNIRRRLSGEPAAERYEVELVGARGEPTRVELSGSVIDSGGVPALLLTALEMMPEAAAPAGLSSRPRAMATLDAMGESVITVNAEGRIDYINHAAEALLGQRLDQVFGKSFPDLASLVDETDRHSLGDPVRMALTAGAASRWAAARCWCR